MIAIAYIVLAFFFSAMFFLLQLALFSKNYLTNAFYIPGLQLLNQKSSKLQIPCAGRMQTGVH